MLGGRTLTSPFHNTNKLLERDPRYTMVISIYMKDLDSFVDGLNHLLIISAVAGETIHTITLSCVVLLFL